ncbi:MAG: hypothetical protein KBA02_04735 [Paludibacteraceae bacterium]|nr:hypothetical protein [Paludibacteraceae bacterium]
MMKKFNFILLIQVALFLSCSHTPERTAADLYQTAQQYFEQNNLNAAKQVIDSIHTTFHNDVEVRKLARELMFKIQQKEEKRNVAYYDSMLLIKEPILAEYSKQFILSKDSEYFDYKLYTHRSQTIAYMPHTNILCEVKENGELTLVSVFLGRKLDHTSFRITAKDIFAETFEVPLSSEYNYHFDDMGSRWEYVTFTPEYQNNVAGFIAQYADQSLKVTLKSQKSSYNYFLEKRDKEAIKEAVDFSIVTKEVYILKQNQKKSSEKLIWLSEKLNQK